MFHLKLAGERLKYHAVSRGGWKQILKHIMDYSLNSVLATTNHLSVTIAPSSGSSLGPTSGLRFAVMSSLRFDN